MNRVIVRLAALLALGLLLGGCRGMPSEKPPIHLNPNMDDQPKYLPQGESGHFYSGAAMQPPVPGTLARGDLREDETFYSGRGFFGGWASNPLQADSAVLARGQERFQIYCRPCHGSRADGKSPMVERTGVGTADLTEERIRQFQDGEIFATISKGQGLMPAYGYLIAPRDRWAIVAYLRRLQEK